MLRSEPRLRRIHLLEVSTSMEANSSTLGFLLHNVARLLRRRFEQNARGSGLTRSQWQVLAYLANNEGINQSGLADLLEIEPITLGRIIDRLQTRGLIERHPDPSDRRALPPHPTPPPPPKKSLLRRPRGRPPAGAPAQDPPDGTRPRFQGNQTTAKQPNAAFEHAGD